MKLSALKQGLNIFNLLFVASFMVLALYSAIGQQIFPYIGQYRVQLENYLGQQLNGEVSIRNLSGDMDVLTPSVHMEGITLHTDDRPDQPKVSVAAIDAVLDPRLSLINLTPVFKSVRLSGLYVHLDGESKQSQRTFEEDDITLIKQVVETLLLQHHVELNNVTIENERDGEISSLFLKHLTMTGDGFHHLITGNLSYGDEEKVDAGLRLYSEGSPFKLQNFYARGALDLPDVDVDYWVNELFGVSVFEEFSTSAQLRFEFKDSLLNYAKLTAASPKVLLEGDQKVEAVSAVLWAKQKAFNNWGFWLENGGFKLAEKDWAFSNVALGLAKLEGGSRWQGYVEDIDLVYLQDFLNTINVIPEEAGEIISDLSIQGHASNLNVILQPQNEDDLSVTVAAELNKVSTQASGGIPGIKNVTGILAINNQGGRVQFEGNELELSFPGIYKSPFEFIKGKGQVDWNISEDGFQLKGTGLSMVMENTQHIRGGFQTWFYNDDILEDKLELNLSLKDADVSAHKNLVPELVSETLRGWLDKSLLNGHANTGQFYMLSGLNESSISQTELSLSVIDGELAYLEQWPHVQQGQGELFVQNDTVLANIQSAKTLGGAASNSQVVFDGIESNRLWISTRVAGASSEGLDYFQTTPLSELIDNFAEPWQASGEHQTDFSLMVPLSEDVSEVLVDVSSELRDTRLNLTDIGLEFTQSNGRISYQSSKGLYSSKLRSRLWDNAVDLGVTSSVYEGGFATDISFEGLANTGAMKEWLDLSLLKPISGKTKVTGQFKIGPDFTGLELESDLKGISLAVPAPYEKLSDETATLKLQLALDDGQKLKLQYDSKINLALHLQQGEIQAGQIFMGATEAYIPLEKGLELQGHIPHIDVQAWKSLWQDIAPKSKHAGSHQILRQAEISTDSLLIDGVNIAQIKASIKSLVNGYEFKVESPLIKGDILWQEQQPIKLALDYIHIPPSYDEELSEQEAKESNAFDTVFPDQFLALNFSVDEIFIGPTNYGQWQGELRNTDNELILQKLKGTIKKLDVNGDARWIKTRDQSLAEKTRVNITLSTKDLGGVQKAWRTKPVIEAKDTKINLDINWLSNPLDVSTQTFSGKVGLNLKDGRFLEVGDAEGLSAFGILNFAAIGRRLRLDFSDVYQSGLHFDAVQGNVKIKDGVMTIIDTLDIKGPSAKFAASGTVNLNNKELNQELSVTFPITSTLPFVAILAGFAPPVAASLFVGEQLVGDQIEKFTSATYRLTGPWDEPQLKLMKRFDNKIEGKQDKGFWYRMKDFFGLGSDK